MTLKQINNTKKLVGALRSGEYKQTSSYLKAKRDDGMYYCCLGVGSELLGCPSKPYSEYTYTFEYDGFGTYFQRPSIPWWIEHYGWDFDHDDSMVIKMNDNRIPFRDIADYIEKTFLPSEKQ